MQHARACPIDTTRIVAMWHMATAAE